MNYIRLADCISCSMSRQAKLCYRKSELAEYDTGVLLIIEDNDKKDEIRTLITDMHINLDYIFDVKNEFAKANPIMAENPICDMCLIDKTGKVIWLGSPIRNEQSLERYRKMMQILQKR